MFHTKFHENRLRRCFFRLIWIFNFFIVISNFKIPMYPWSFLCKAAKIKRHTVSKKELCEISQKAIWEFRLTYFFISNEFIHFLESILIFSIFFTSKVCCTILKNERNVTNFGYVCVPKFHIILKNFLNDCRNSCTPVIGSIYYQKRYFENWKNSYGFWKINKFIWSEKRIGYPIIYYTIILFTTSLMTFQHYYYAK